MFPRSSETVESGVLPTPHFRVGRIGCYVADRLLNRNPHCLYFPFEYLQCTRHIFISSSQPSEVGAILPILQMKLRPEIVTDMCKFTLLKSRTEILIKSLTLKATSFFMNCFSLFFKFIFLYFSSSPFIHPPYTRPPPLPPQSPHCCPCL